MMSKSGKFGQANCYHSAHHHDCHSQQVQLKALLAKGSEKARAQLQTRW
jgi:hypothetical protein